VSFGNDSLSVAANTTVDLEATGFIDIQTMGTSKSKIDTSSNFGGGNITLHAGTNVTVNGPLTTNANDPAGAAFGGSVDIQAATGNISIIGDPAEGIRSNGKTFGDAQAPFLPTIVGANPALALSPVLWKKAGSLSGLKRSLIYLPLPRLSG
jgi:hypothetical protein